MAIMKINNTNIALKKEWLDTAVRSLGEMFIFGNLMVGFGCDLYKRDEFT